jgi:hypothetical protein
MKGYRGREPWLLGQEGRADFKTQNESKQQWGSRLG